MTRNQVIESFSSIGLNLSDLQVSRFVQYYELLVEWNHKMNLTAITSPNEVLVKHFVDSVLSYRVYDFNKASSLIDIGTGAGFPGIPPLKIVFPHLEVTLLDALSKRVQFLNTVIDSLELDDVEAIHGRAEDLARTDYRESFDISVSRAVSQLNVLCEYCLPFIKCDGYFISYKGSRTLEEVETSHNAIDVLGGKLTSVTDTIELSKDIKRGGFVVISKVKETPERYPRRSGKPSKKPL